MKYGVIIPQSFTKPIILKNFITMKYIYDVIAINDSSHGSTP